MTHPVTIHFKGDRTYAQIADIFTHMVGAAGATAGQDLLFSVHKPLLTPFASVELVPTGDTPAPGFAARLDFVDAKGERYQAVVYPAPRDEPFPRRAFDEEALREKITLEGQSAMIEVPVDNDFAELITAMNKKLLQALFPQDDKKWWAVRLQLKTFQTEWQNVVLTCKTTQLSRVYNTKIAVDGVEIGEISFVARPA